MCLLGKFKDCETRCSAYDREALAVVDAVSRIWKVYLLGCKYFSAVTYHETLTHLSKQGSDKITDHQVHRVERLMLFAQCTSILYRTRFVNAADIVSGRRNFSHPDDVHMRMLAEVLALLWEGNVRDMCYHNNDSALLLISADDISVNNDFLTKLNIAHSSCLYFYDEIKVR